MDKKTIISLKD